MDLRMKNPSFHKSPAFITVLLLVVFTTIFLPACSLPAATTGRIGVMVTLPPQEEFVKNVGGNRVTITVMVPPGASPHTYEPTPSQMTALAKAEIYYKVGSGVEFEIGWLDKLIAINPGISVVDGSRGVELNEMPAGDEDGDDNHPHSADDPHIWMSPKNVKTMVSNICDGLIEIDPDNQTYYLANRDAYLVKIDELDLDIHQGLSAVSNRAIMTYHPAFGYFAEDYNLTMLVIEEAGKEPTAQNIASLIRLAKERNIKIILASPQYNTEIAEIIAGAIGGRVVLIDSLAGEYILNLRTILDILMRVME